MRFRVGLIPTVATIAGLALLLWLGTWQAQRYLERVDKDAQLAERLQMPPITLTDLSKLDPSMDDRYVELVGEFDTDFVALMKFRVLDGRPGSWVLSPFLLRDGGTILVNRGWIPASSDVDTVRDLPWPRTLVGIVHTPDRIIADDRTRNASPPLREEVTEWNTFDLEALYGGIEGKTPDRMTIVILGPESSGDPLPIASHAHITQTYLTAEKHLSYAVTWYGTAVALIAFYLAAGFGLINRRRKTATERAAPDSQG